MIVQKNIRFLAWFNFFVNFEPHMPIAIIYFARVTDSFALGMTVFSVSMLSSSLLEVPTGVLSDMLGRKKTMMLGGVAGTLSVLSYALADSFWVLALGAALEGLMSALYSGNNNAFLHDTLKQEGREEEYSQYLGRTSAFFQAGLGTSALLGSAVAYLFSLTAVFWVGVLPRFMCVLVSLLMVEPKVHSEEVPTNIFSHLKEALIRFKRNAKLRTLSLATILDFGLGQAAYLFLPAFYNLFWPVWAMGFARLISSIAAFTSFWFAGSWIKRFKPLETLIIVKGGGHFVTFFAYGVPTALSPLILSCLSIGYGVKTVAKNTLLQKEFSDRQRATMESLNQLAGNILFAIFAYFLGFFADSIGPRNALLIIECILFMGLFLYWRVFYHHNHS